jgi:hypothetical protein
VTERERERGRERERTMTKREREQRTLRESLREYNLYTYIYILYISK